MDSLKNEIEMWKQEIKKIAEHLALMRHLANNKSKQWSIDFANKKIGSLSKISWEWQIKFIFGEK